MTSRERLAGTLQFQPVDRVPISTYELVALNPDAWENKDPSYAELMRAIRQRTDCIYMWGSGLPNKARVEQEHEQKVLEDGAIHSRDVIHTPRGDLTTSNIRRPDVHTTWKIEPLLKTDVDVERWLSIPFEPGEVNASGWFTARERVGEDGIVLTSIGDPLCHVAELFDFGDFTVRAMFQTRQIERLIAVCHERVIYHLKSLLAAGVGDLFRIVGPEYATPPYLPGRIFDQLVTPYDKEMIGLIHGAGAWARVHCHGRVKDALESMIRMGADSTDPLEPPPQGDITLARAKAVCGARMGIMGNIELRDLEMLERDQIKRLIRDTMEAGKPGGGFVIMPTAAPIDSPLSPKTRDNYLAFIETALEYGKY